LTILKNKKKVNVKFTQKSMDPRKLMLDGYALASGNTSKYIVKLEAKTENGNSSSASVVVNVTPGPLVVKIAGGLVRSSAFDKPLLLSAAGSVDLNNDPARIDPFDKPLNFSWSCKIVSASNYGKGCNSIFNSTLGRERSYIKIENMTLGHLYEVGVLVSTADGRSKTATVKVTPTQPKTAVVRIQSNTIKFNVQSVLNLVGTISGSSKQIATVIKISVLVYI